MNKGKTKKPLIVYVTGAPGSGKTTLAKLISDQLFIPHVSSDLIHGGVRVTDGGDYNRLYGLHNVFVPIMMDMAKLNISFVVDHVLQKDKSKADIIGKLLPLAKIVYIHTVSDVSVERHLQRELNRDDRGKVLDGDGLRARADFHATNLSQTVSPADWEKPVLVVKTDDGYDPILERVLDYIQEQYYD